MSEDGNKTPEDAPAKTTTASVYAEDFGVNEILEAVSIASAEMNSLRSRCKALAANWNEVVKKCSAMSTLRVDIQNLAHGYWAQPSSEIDRKEVEEFFRFTDTGAFVLEMRKLSKLKHYERMRYAREILSLGFECIRREKLRINKLADRVKREASNTLEKKAASRLLIKERANLQKLQGRCREVVSVFCSTKKQLTNMLRSTTEFFESALGNDSAALGLNPDEINTLTKFEEYEKARRLENENKRIDEA